MARPPVFALAIAVAAALHLTAAPALAQAAPQSTPQTGTMTDTERDSFRAEVRAYLMEHPEVIFEAVSEFERRNQEQQASMDTTLVELNADEIYRDGHSWVGGNPDGDLTLVEFMDYRCGFCRRAQPQVMDLLGSDGNIRLVIKEFPILGPQSEVMSRFAVAVQQLGGDTPFADVHERLMGWDGDIADADIRAISAELGLDGDAVLAQMSDGAVTEVLRANHELAQRLQISGTPTFVLGSGDGGELLRGFMQADEMEAVATRLRG